MWAIELVLLYLWLAYSLKRFPYTRPWGEVLGGYLLTTFQTLLLGAVGTLPGLLVVVIILFVTRVMVRWVRAFFNAVEAGKVALHGIYSDTAPATRTIIVILLWLFALIAAYPYIPGSNTQAFKAVGVFLGLVISLSSSGLLAQAMSGFVLMYSRALKPGEYVSEGVVDSVGMFSTKIRTIGRCACALVHLVRDDHCAGATRPGVRLHRSPASFTAHGGGDDSSSEALRRRCNRRSGFGSK
jgi:small-conductance mechanosensitive channel